MLASILSVFLSPHVWDRAFTGCSEPIFPSAAAASYPRSVFPLSALLKSLAAWHGGLSHVSNIIETFASYGDRNDCVTLYVFWGLAKK